MFVPARNNYDTLFQNIAFSKLGQINTMFMPARNNYDKLLQNIAFSKLGQINTMFVLTRITMISYFRL